MSDSNPNVVGINVLKQNGLDADELVKELIKNAAVEFTAYYYFTNLRAHCTGIEGEGLKGIIEDARLEDLSHFESCLERIYQLGGILPNDATEFIKMSGCEFLQLPTNPTDVLEVASILELDEESLEMIKQRNEELAFLVRVKKVNFEKSCKEYKDDDIDGQKIKISVE